MTLGPWKTSFLLMANVAAGVVAPWLIGRASGANVSVSDGAILALLVIVTLSLAEMVYLLDSLARQRAASIELWEQQEEIDTAIAGLRVALHKMVTAEPLRDSFYLDHYRREIALLDRRLQTTINTKQILLDRFHIESTEVLLSIYDHKDVGLLRATHCLSDIGDDFDATYRVYFNAILQRLRDGRISELRRLFVFDDLEQFARPTVAKLIGFHLSDDLPKLQARVIDRTQLHRFKTDYQITNTSDDIGIFADKYVYLGQVRHESDIAGVFSRDRAMITDYTRMFDAVWSSSASSPASDFVRTPTTLEELSSPKLADGNAGPNGEGSAASAAAMEDPPETDEEREG